MKVLSISLVISVALLLGAGSAFAENLKVTLACPTSVNYGTGATTLNVTVYLENWDCNESVTVKRYMSALIANPTNTLGGIGVYGPFPRWLSSAKTVPAANCTPHCTNPNGCPGTIPGFTVPVAIVPNVTNKMAFAVIQFITSSGQSIGGAECSVSILP